MIDEDDPEWCPHFADGTPKAQCSKCSGSEARREAEGRRVERRMRTIFGFHCAICAEWREIGSTMLSLADGRNVCEYHGL